MAFLNPDQINLLATYNLWILNTEIRRISDIDLYQNSDDGFFFGWIYLKRHTLDSKIKIKIEIKINKIWMVVSRTFYEVVIPINVALVIANIDINI